MAGRDTSSLRQSRINWMSKTPSITLSIVVRSNHNEDKDNLLSELCGGLILGSREVIDTLPQKLKSDVQMKQPKSGGSIDERVKYNRNRMGLSGGELEGLVHPDRRQS